MKGYKAFEKGLICRGKQYQENTDYEEAGGKLCEEGMMHFCKEPFEVLSFYPLIDDNGDFTEFAEVEAPDEEVVSDEKKCASRKLHIGAKLKFKDFIEAGVNVLVEKNDGEDVTTDHGNNWAQIGSSGDWAQIGSSGDWAQIGSSGDRAQIGSSGDWANIGSSGDWAQIGSSGDRAQIGSSGDGAQINVEGQNSVAMCAGNNCTIKAGMGCRITLAEWKWVDDVYTPVCVRSGQIDGVNLLPGVAYQLKNGEFVKAGGDEE